MLGTQKIAENQVSTFSNEINLVDTDLGNSRIGFGIIMVLAGFIGIWGAICLFNGFVQANSFQQLGQGLFTAITGL